MLAAPVSNKVPAAANINIRPMIGSIMFMPELAKRLVPTYANVPEKSNVKSVIRYIGIPGDMRFCL
jgi:hypothetical protein